jgi:hypothetical protein
MTENKKESGERLNKASIVVDAERNTKIKRLFQ